MTCWNKEELENMLEDVVNELDLSETAIEEHGPVGTPPAELVRLVLAQKDRQIHILKKRLEQKIILDDKCQYEIFLMEHNEMEHQLYLNKILEDPDDLQNLLEQEVTAYIEDASIYYEYGSERGMHKEHDYFLSPEAVTVRFKASSLDRLFYLPNIMSFRPQNMVRPHTLRDGKVMTVEAVLKAVTLIEEGGKKYIQATYELDFSD